MLRRIAKYKNVLEAYSRATLPFIQWKRSAENNVQVLNETAWLFRYFDATPQSEFLYASVRETIEIDLPHEIAFLDAYRRFSQGIRVVLEMPDTKVNLLQRFLEQNNGIFSKRARGKEFALLTDDEVRRIEELYSECFSDVPRQYLS